ncbi:LAFA_0E00914g1_1 [Lachancea sp. 'fantastica']|nr:LAFA_0E00914g1_1 [Lachancea sp. 'fantastica']
MGLSAWNELLEAHREPHTEESDQVTLVLSAETQNTLQNFLVEILQIEDENSSLAAIGYYHKILETGNERNRAISVHIYTVAWPSTATAVDLLSIFVGPDTVNVRWGFLLDWQEGSHKTWLRGLRNSFDLLQQKLGRDLQKLDFCTIVLMGAQVCVGLDLRSPQWNSLKMEFLNQSLRSLAFIRRASLLAVEQDSAPESLIEIRRVMLGQESSQTPNYIEMDKLFVPRGCDSESKIKTMGENFPVLQIEAESFIAGQFERHIPGASQKEDTDPEYSSDASLSPTVIPEIDVQAELAKIYEDQKSSLLNINGTQNSPIDIPNAKEAVDL